jgi:hypothetical protein
MKTIEIRTEAESLLSPILSSYKMFKTRPNDLVHDPDSGASDLPACAIYFDEGQPDNEYADIESWSASLHVELFNAQHNDVDDALESDAKLIISALINSNLNGEVGQIRSPKFMYNRDPETSITALDLTFTLQWEE